jgi:hypothetical protein
MMPSRAIALIGGITLIQHGSLQQSMVLISMRSFYTRTWKLPTAFLWLKLRRNTKVGFQAKHGIGSTRELTKPVEIILTHYQVPDLCSFLFVTFHALTWFLRRKRDLSKRGDVQVECRPLGPRAEYGLLWRRTFSDHRRAPC